MPLLTPQQTVRFLILGLPIGLILTGTLAMFIYFKVDEVHEEQSSRVPVRRLLNDADLRAQVRTLAAGIGSRHAGVPETLSSAQKYIQSTLGPANLGFQVSRHEFAADGQTYYNLVIDLPGAPGPRAEEIVLVTANYDSTAGSPGANANATGIAALMSLAQSFAGSASARTLRFAALVNESPPYAGTPRSGSVAYTASLRTRQDNVVAVVSLEGLGCYLDAPGSQKSPAGPATPFPDTGNFLALIANPAGAQWLGPLGAEFTTATRLPLEPEDAASLPVLLGTATARTFDQAGFPVLLLTDTGALRDPHFQQPGDTPDRIDYLRFLEAVRGIEAMLRSLVNPAPVRS
ncbi:MAG: M28 family peptidase [Verrucomicrobiota bacterium]